MVKPSFSTMSMLARLLQLSPSMMTLQQWQSYRVCRVCPGIPCNSGVSLSPVHALDCVSLSPMHALDDLKLSVCVLCCVHSLTVKSLLSIAYEWDGIQTVHEAAAKCDDQAQKGWQFCCSYVRSFCNLYIYIYKKYMLHSGN